MKKSYFADTSYYIVVLNREDEFHKQALELGNLASDNIVTTQWVLMELVDGFCSPRSRKGIYKFVKTLSAQQNVSVVPSSDDWFQRGLEFFIRRPDKEWSLTDCISFLVMRERRIANALTNDHHFEQTGFKVLLR